MSTTVEEIKAALANGRAVLRVIKSEEAWYRESAMLGKPAYVEKDWSVGVDVLNEDGREDGTYGEFAITWYRLDGRREALSMHVEAFTDAFVAMRAVDGLLEGLFALPEDVTPEQVDTLLAGLGFKDATPRDQTDRNRRYADLLVDLVD